MIVEVFFGEISDERKLNWDNGEEDPFNVLKKNYRVEWGDVQFLSDGDVYFHEQIQVDWGSYAWKCSKAEFVDYLKMRELKVSKELDWDSLPEDGQYGVVFIEMS